MNINKNKKEGKMENPEKKASAYEVEEKVTLENKVDKQIKIAAKKMALMGSFIGLGITMLIMISNFFLKEPVLIIWSLPLFFLLGAIIFVLRAEKIIKTEKVLKYLLADLEADFDLTKRRIEKSERTLTELRSVIAVDEVCPHSEINKSYREIKQLAKKLILQTANENEEEADKLIKKIINIHKRLEDFEDCRLILTEEKNNFLTKTKEEHLAFLSWLIESIEASQECLSERAEAVMEKIKKETLMRIKQDKQRVLETSAQIRVINNRLGIC